MMREAPSCEKLGARAGCGQCLRLNISYAKQGPSAVQHTRRSGALAQEADHGLASECPGCVHGEMYVVVVRRADSGSGGIKMQK